MLHVLLVDDEAAVTDSMQRGIDWGALDLQVDAAAASGREALDYIRSHAVDIVITDIRMADMDGLSLCQQISRLDRNIQSIIVSGFAEFSYAQKALSYGVIGYCLKPIEYGELTRCLQLAVRRRGHAPKAPDLDGLLDALHRDDTREIRRQLKAHGFAAQSYYAAASFSKSPVMQTGPAVLSLRMGHKRFAYLCTRPIVPEALARDLSRSHCKCLSCCPDPIPVEQLGSAIKKLNNGVFQYFFDESAQINTRLEAPRRLAAHRAVSKAAAERDTPALLQLLQQMKDCAPEHLSLGGAWNLYGVLASSEAYGPVTAIDDLYTPEQMVFKFGSFSHMIDTLCARIRESAQEGVPARLSNTAFLNMIGYIDRRLSGDCSLQQLAKEMNMTANYLGQVFKRETGKSYTQYITQLRIERAKEMLLSRDLSIGQISASLGFNDYFYFLKTFKRVTGVTPKQYRQNQAMGGGMLFAEQPAP